MGRRVWACAGVWKACPLQTWSGQWRPAGGLGGAGLREEGTA